MMHQSLSGSESGLVGYWRLDEGSGTTTANSSSYGSAFNGTLNNSPTWSISSAPIGLPMATTLVASSVGVSSATLNGSVLPNYQDTTAYFDYGQTTAYGSTTATTPVGANNSSDVGVSLGTGSLESGRTYHFRLAAGNSAGTAYGDDVSFATPASSDASLSSLSLSAGTLSPAFSSGTADYTASVPSATASVTVTPAASESHAAIQVRINGGAFAPIASGATSTALALNIGYNPIDVMVMAQDGVTVRTYTITVYRTPSANAYLSALSLSAGTLSPTFSAGTTVYSGTVPSNTTSITVTATTADTNATLWVRVNGGTYAAAASGMPSVALSLNESANLVDVRVVAQDGVTERTYTVSVLRPSSNANVSWLQVETASGTKYVSPSFTSGMTNYTCEVTAATDWARVLVTASNTNSTLRLFLNDVDLGAMTSDVLGSAFGIVVGTNRVRLRVTAEDGTTVRAYFISVHRPSDDAYLSSLTLSAGTLSPGFQKLTYKYTASVPYTVSNLVVTPTAESPEASVMIEIGANGYVPIVSGQPSAPLPLVVGQNFIAVAVIPEDVYIATKFYDLTVTRSPSTNARLASLILSQGDLEPPFISATTNYQVTVGAAVASLTVTPTVEDPTASIQLRFNGGAYNTNLSGMPSSELPLRSGVNTIDLRATAQNGTTVMD